MNHRIFAGFFPMVLVGLLVPQLAPANTVASSTDNHVASNTFRLTPGPWDGRIALATAQMLEKYQYQRQPFTPQLSSKFLDRYLESLDPQHLHFIQADLDQFERFR